MDEAQSINDALAALRPEMKRAKRNAVIWVSVLGVVTAAVAIALYQVDQTEPVWSMMAALLGGIAIAVVVHKVRIAHERAVMPVLAQSIGLSHSKYEGLLRDQLPPGVIPRGKLRIDDVLSGRVGERFIEFAEAKVETGGTDKKTTVFSGIVVMFPLALELPEFLIADEKGTRGVLGLGFGQTVNTGEAEKRSVIPGPDGESYGLWSLAPLGPDAGRVRPLIDRLLGLRGKLHADAHLLSARIVGKRIFIALRHRSNLFQIGGLFAGDSQLTADVRQALRELNLPMQVAAEILAAEAEIAASLRTVEPAADQVPDGENHGQIQQ